MDSLFLPMNEWINGTALRTHRGKLHHVRLHSFDNDFSVLEHEKEKKRSKQKQCAPDIYFSLTLYMLPSKDQMSGLNNKVFLQQAVRSRSFRIDLFLNTHFADGDLSPQQAQFAFCVCLCAHLGRPVPQTVHCHPCAVVRVSHVDDRLSDGLDHLLLTSEQTQREGTRYSQR